MGAKRDITPNRGWGKKVLEAKLMRVGGWEEEHPL
jgi:hypothetical protein